MARRNEQARLAAIEGALAQRDDFLRRLEQARGSTSLWLMAIEAIDMHLAANTLETVGHDMRVRISMESICASHCLKALRDASSIKP